MGEVKKWLMGMIDEGYDVEEAEAIWSGEKPPCDPPEYDSKEK